MEKATFAGGCFWCMEPPFVNQKGVHKVLPGYMGGDTDNPTYEDICTGTTGHAEVVQVEFDPKVVSYEQLLEIFWRNIDPTTIDKQFADEGSQYRTEIFYHSQEQKELAEKSKQDLIDSKKFGMVVTNISEASTFYVAEEYHQAYYLKQPTHYKMYRMGSGREDYLNKTWNKK